MGIVDEVYDGESSSLVDEVYNESAPVKPSMWSKIAAERPTFRNVMTLQQPLRVAGHLASGLNDMVGGAINWGLDLVTPDILKEKGKEGIQAILNTPIGKKGLQALQAGQDVWDNFEKNYPDIAKDVKAAANILGAASVSAPIAKEGINIGRDVTSLAKNAIPASIPEWLYGSATKMPLGKKWTQVLPGQEISDRTKAIRAGIQSKVLPTEYGLAKVTALEKEARGIVDGVVDKLTAQGKQIKRDDIIKGLDKAYAKAENSSNPDIAKRMLDRLKEDFSKRPETLTPKEVNTIKRQFYDETSWGTPPARSVPAQFKEMGTKGLARNMMLELEKLHPELKVLNQTDAAYIKLKEGIERAVGRLGNRDLIGLGEEIAATAGGAIAGAPGAGMGFAFKRILDMPTVKSQLAFALSKSEKFMPKSKAGQFIMGHEDWLTSIKDTAKNALKQPPFKGE